MEGPLRALKTLMDDKKRVKVNPNIFGLMAINFGYFFHTIKIFNFQIYTRDEHGVRGYVTGFVVLFDKHWNMVISDVLEVWKRRKAHYCQTAAQPASNADDCAKRLKELNITVPVIKVKSLNRKNIECSRRVTELLVRGENVVCIMLAEMDATKADGT